MNTIFLFRKKFIPYGIESKRMLMDGPYPHSGTFNEAGNRWYSGFNGLIAYLRIGTIGVETTGIAMKLYILNEVSSGFIRKR